MLLVSAPVPLGLIWVSNWVWVTLGGVGTKNLGPGLDKIIRMYMYKCIIPILLFCCCNRWTPQFVQSLKITRHHSVLSGANEVIQAMISDFFQDRSFNKNLTFSLYILSTLTSEVCWNKKVGVSPTLATLTAYYADKMSCVVSAIYGLYAARASQSGVSSPSVNTSRDHVRGWQWLQ